MAAVLVVAIVSLMLGAAIFARLYLTEARARELTVDVFGRVLQGRLELGAFRWVRFPERVRLEEVLVFAPGGERVIEAREIEVEIALSHLLYQEVALRALSFRNAKINLKPPRSAPARFSLIDAFLPAGHEPEAERSDADASAWRVEIASLQLENLEVVLELETLGVEARGLRIARGSLELRLPGVKASIEGLQARSLRLRVDGRAIGFEPLAVARLRYARNEAASFEVSGVEARAQGVKLEGDLRLGELELDHPWTLGGVLRATVALDAPALALEEVFTTAEIDAGPPEGEVALTITAAGTLEDPQLEVEASSTRISVAGLPFVNTELVAGLQGGKIKITSLRTSHAGAKLTGSAEAALLPLPGDFFASLKVVNLPPSVAKVLGVPGAWLPERLDLSFRADGTLASTLGDGSVRYHLDATARGLPSVFPAGLPDPWTLEGKGRVSEKGLTLAPATLRAGALEITARGDVKWRSVGKGLDLELEVKTPKLAEVIVPLGGEALEGVDGGVSAILELRGELSSPTLRGLVRLKTLKSPWLPPLSGTLPLEWDGRVLSVRDGRLGLAGGTLHLDGGLVLLGAQESLGGSTVGHVAFQAQQIDLAALGLPELRGKLQAQGQLRGSLFAPSGRVSLSVRDASAGGVPLERAEAVVLAQGGALQVTRLRLAPREGGVLDGRGRVDLGARTLSLLLELKALPLRLARPFLPADLGLRGSLGADLELAGAFDDPVLSGPLVVEGLSVRGLGPGTLRAEVGGTRRALRLDATLEGAPGSVHLKGTVIDDGRAVRSVKLSTEGLSLSKLLALETETKTGSDSGAVLREEPQQGRGAEAHTGEHSTQLQASGTAANAPPPLDGMIVADLRLSGPLPLPEIQGQVRVVDLKLAGVPAPGGDALMQLSPRRDPEAPGAPGLQASLAALGVLDLSAQLRLDDTVSGGLRVSGAGRLRRFALGALLPLLHEIDTEVVLAGQLRFDLAGASWDLSATLPTVEVELASGKLIQEAPVKLQVSSEGLSIDPFVLAGAGGRLEAGGHVGEELSLQARGEIDLSLLPPFVPAIARATGRAQVAVRARGTPELPDLSGTIALVGPATLRPRTAVREVRLLAGAIDLQGQDAILKGIVGEIGSGTFSASGRLTLVGKNRGAHHLAVRALGLPLRLPDLVLEVNGTLYAMGTLPATRLSGEVEVVRGRYLRKFELKRFNFKAQKIELDEPLSATYPFLETVSLDLRAVSAGGLEVIANAGPFSLSLLLDSDLRIQGTAADPVIEGRVLSSQGEIAFPAATLAVGEARIDFEPSGGSGIAPFLNLRAEGEVTPPLIGTDAGQPTYFVTVGLSGDPFAEMPLVLTSDPALSQLEILSLLTTGRVSPSLGASGIASGSGAGASGLAGGDAAIAFAGSQLAGPLTRFVTRQLERNLNLELQLDAGLSSTGVTVSAGKEISRRLRLEGSFQRTFEVQSIAVGRARFLLSDRLFLEYTGESVTGQSSGAASAQEGSSSRLELKLRILGQ